MLARTPEEAIDRLKALMSNPSATVASLDAQAPRPSSSGASRLPAAKPTDAPRVLEFSSTYSSAPDPVTSPSCIQEPVTIRSPGQAWNTTASVPASPSRMQETQPARSQVDTEVVNALLHSLEKKQRECDKAYELMQGTDLTQALRQQALLGEVKEASWSKRSSPARANKANRRGSTAIAKRRAGKAAGDTAAGGTEGSLGGRVINQLIKQAKDSDMTSLEMQQKYQKAVLDVASLRRQLKEANSQSSSLKKQLSHHQDEEHKLRQRLMEQRIKVSRQAGASSKTLEDMDSLRQKVAKERAEHEVTKQRLQALHHSQKLKKEAVALGMNEELQKEREATAALRQELVERREELEGAAEEITRLNELAEHKSMQLLSVVRQLQDERQAAEEHRSEALERERRAEDISMAARDAVVAADALSSKLRDQNSTIKALKAERDHAKANLAHAQRELADLRASFDETAGEHNTDRQKLEMMEADVGGVCEVLEAAAATEPSFLTMEGDPVHRLRLAADALVRFLDSERQQLGRDNEALSKECGMQQQDSSALRSEVLRLKGELGVLGAQAQEREASLRKRIRRAEQDRDECLAAAGRADTLLARLAAAQNQRRHQGSGSAPGSPGRPDDDGHIL